MEKKLTRDELLLSLLKKARNPFTTIEQKNDIKRILMESNTMKGMNHLFLAQCHFDDNPLFQVSEEEATRQALLAYKENNTGCFYYLYLLNKNRNEAKARNYLRLSCTYGNPRAYLEMAKLLHKGILFPKDRVASFNNYKKAARCNLEEGYFGMLLLASEDGSYELEKEIYEEAKKKGFILPGVIK